MAESLPLNLRGLRVLFSEILTRAIHEAPNFRSAEAEALALSRMRAVFAAESSVRGPALAALDSLLERAAQAPPELHTLPLDPEWAAEQCNQVLAAVLDVFVQCGVVLPGTSDFLAKQRYQRGITLFATPDEEEEPQARTTFYEDQDSGLSSQLSLVRKGATLILGRRLKGERKVKTIARLRLSDLPHLRSLIDWASRDGTL